MTASPQAQNEDLYLKTVFCFLSRSSNRNSIFELMLIQIVIGSFVNMGLYNAGLVELCLLKSIS